MKKLVAVVACTGVIFAAGAQPVVKPTDALKAVKSKAKTDIKTTTVAETTKVVTCDTEQVIKQTITKLTFTLKDTVAISKIDTTKSTKIDTLKRKK